jgi:hypothetical protein
MRDALGVEPIGEMEVAIASAVAISGAGHDSPVAEAVDEPRIVRLGGWSTGLWK